MVRRAACQGYRGATNSSDSFFFFIAFFGQRTLRSDSKDIYSQSEPPGTTAVTGAVGAADYPIKGAEPVEEQ